MKIATFNINNINSRLPQLIAWLRSAKPDVVCLQELKAEQHKFPDHALEAEGYLSVWIGQKSWNGVAIIAKGRTPVVTRVGLPGDPSDKQSRYIEAAVDGILIASIYAPNGNPQPGPKFDYKLKWLQRLKRHGNSLLKTGAPVVLAGDYNVAPTALDIYPTKSWDDDALIHPKARAAFVSLANQGWTDAVRALQPEKRVYTFWTYWRNRYERDDGLRLDHFLLSPDLRRRLQTCGVDRAARGVAGASDHAPCWIILEQAGANGTLKSEKRAK